MRILLIFSLMAGFSLSEEHNHIEFKGNIKGTDAPCFLHVEDVYYENEIVSPENLRAEVVAFLEEEDDHGGHIEDEHDFTFVISPNSVRPNLYSGIAANEKDQMNIMATADSIELDELDFYALKWWHISHFHSIQCVNLEKVDEDDDHDHDHDY